MNSYWIPPRFTPLPGNMYAVCISACVFYGIQGYSLSELHWRAFQFQFIYFATTSVLPVYLHVYVYSANPDSTERHPAKSPTIHIPQSSPPDQLLTHTLTPPHHHTPFTQKSNRGSHEPPTSLPTEEGDYMRVGACAWVT